MRIIFTLIDLHFFLGGFFEIPSPTEPKGLSTDVLATRTSSTRAPSCPRCLVVFRGANASRAYTALENGTWVELGGGDGRCLCNDGWMGPYCNIPTQASTVIPDPWPAPTQTGAELEAWIDRLCAEVAANESSNLATVCTFIRPVADPTCCLCHCSCRIWICGLCAYRRLDWVARSGSDFAASPTLSTRICIRPATK